jgi:hypothetical protein
MKDAPQVYIINKDSLPRAIRNKRISDLVPKDINGRVVEEADVVVVVDDINFKVIKCRTFFNHSGPISELVRYLLNLMPTYYEQWSK